MSTLSPFDKHVIKSITKLEPEFDKLEVLDIWNSAVGRFIEFKTPNQLSVPHLPSEFIGGDFRFRLNQAINIGSLFRLKDGCVDFIELYTEDSSEWPNEIESYENIPGIK